MAKNRNRYSFVSIDLYIFIDKISKSLTCDFFLSSTHTNTRSELVASSVYVPESRKIQKTLERAKFVILIISYILGFLRFFHSFRVEIQCARMPINIRLIFNKRGGREKNISIWQQNPREKWLPVSLNRDRARANRSR